MSTDAAREKARDRARERRANDRSERAARQAEVEQHFADHAEYVQLCQEHGLGPIPLGLQWEFVRMMWSLGPHLIPYLAPVSETIWVRDLRHKHNRLDRPFSGANLDALMEPKT